MYQGLLELVNVKYDSVIVFKSNRANQVSEWNTAAAEMMRTEGVTAHLHIDPGVSVRKKKVGKKKQFRFKPKKGTMHPT